MHFFEVKTNPSRSYRHFEVLSNAKKLMILANADISAF